MLEPPVRSVRLQSLSSVALAVTRTSFGDGILTRARALQLALARPHPCLVRYALRSEDLTFSCSQ